MKILVTGGAGFIGSKIVARYRALGHLVAAFDKYVPFHDGIVGDVTDRREVRRAVWRFAPDVISHHAANVDIQGSIELPSQDALENIVGTAIVAEAAREYGVRRLIYASSSSCYGQQDTQPVAETAPIRPLNPYGWSKYAAEYYVRSHEEAVILRYGNVYGPGQSLYNRGVVGVFALQVLNGEPPTLYGNATHDFVYIADVVEANVLALSSMPGTANIGSGIGHSVEEVLTLVTMAVGRAANASVHRPMQPGTYRKMILDVRRAEEVMGWRPKTILQDGIKATCDWVKDR